MAASFKISSPSPTRTPPKSLSSISRDGTENCGYKTPASLIYFPMNFLETTTWWRAPTSLFLILVSFSIFGFFFLYCSPNAISQEAIVVTRPAGSGLTARHANSIRDSSDGCGAVTGRWIKTDALLWPGWQVLVIVSLEEELMPPRTGENYTCFYPNGENLPARFTAILPFTNRTIFRCNLPGIYRHHHPIPMPILTSSPAYKLPPEARWRRLPLWNFVVFEAISTENDVVLFVKGPNRGLGSNKPPETFQCVFGERSESAPVVRTAVTSSVQEVFRCPHPNRTFEKPIKIYLETTVTAEKRKEIIPSVAYYTPWCSVAEPRKKSLLCATTMVYNVAKFLREWVMYHAKIGVQKFIIYDNESNDGLNDVVQELNRDGYDVVAVFWIWPKTQEAGFSHAAVYGNSSCTWMMYLDVDEFLFSPAWQNESRPSDQIIRSLLQGSSLEDPIGQISFKSMEFGPSNQTVNPPYGVTQGYTCRRREEQRHKSIVRLEAVEHSLYTAIHHFGLREGYGWRVGETDEAVVNHYKYQAWADFKAKFRRRVSAYVVDWTRVSNPNSRDRTPGLGFRPIEPKNWAQRFCEVRDDRLQRLTRKWFGYPTRNGYRMAWQR